MASNPKIMSSRLAGMKFMQRSAPKSTPSDPSTPNGPPAKRVRLSNGTVAPSTPSDYDVHTPGTPDDGRQEEALNRAGALRGETKWVLSVQENKSAQAQTQPFTVVHAGFATIDADDEESEEESRPARMQFGGGLKKKAQAAASDSDDSGEESDSSDYDSDDPTAELIRETKREVAAKERDARKAQKKDDARGDSARTPAATPKKNIVHEDADLGGLTSLSGGRGGGGNASNMECYTCHEKGHISRDCPRLARKNSGRGRGSRGRGGGGFRR